MCGVTGFWTTFSETRDKMLFYGELMTNSLFHRGPDDYGLWCDQGAGLVLGHRRLAILDLSSSGHQPMISSTGRWVIAYNGEIYNHRQLRADLESISLQSGQSIAWRGGSDTETLLTAIEIWGLRGTLERLVGMFAFALWDRQERVLTLVRDRMGEKPMYYGWQSGLLIWGSELKALCAHPQFVSEINTKAVSVFFRYGYIPGPDSIYKGVYKLPPGTFLSFSETQVKLGQWQTPTAYWTLSKTISEGIQRPFEGDEGEAAEELERLLAQAVSGQMVADVPLGAFLSGGIDSSSVVALMQKHSWRPIRTFTIGFHEFGYNEAPFAAKVANHLGTDHTQLYLTPQEASELIPKMPLIYDEPFADASQVPTFLVSQLARKYVKVCLSGDGGDELFGGYNRYILARRVWEAVSWMPVNLRRGTVFQFV